MKKFLGVALVAYLSVAGSTQALLFTGQAVGEWDPTSIVEQNNGEWFIDNFDTDSGGNAKVRWGVQNGNYKSTLRFDGAGSDDQMPVWEGESDGDAFFLGELFYHNGVQNAGTGIKGVDLAVDIDILTPDGIGLGDFVFDLKINNTANPNGDTVLGLETGASVIEFDYLSTTYAFELLGFANGPGDPYLSSLFRKEGENITVNLYGKITAIPNNAVPDGGSTLLLLGLTLLAVSQGRRALARRGVPA